jgi:hypothetical protein
MIIDRFKTHKYKRFTVLADSHNLQFPTARIEFPEPAVSSPVAAW